jgi:hypothetical protein
MALMLAVSARNLGGQLSSSPLRVYFASSPGSFQRRQFERLGAEVILTGPLSRAAAKAHILQDHAERGEGTLVSVDGGMALLGDLADEANPDALRGRPQTSSPLSDEQWRAWLDFRRLPPPPTTFATGEFATGERGPGTAVLQMSTSVLIVPKRLCHDLAASWAVQAQALTEAFTAAAVTGPRPPEQARGAIDEVALACAVLETGTPVDPLGPGCNFHPTREFLEISGIGQVQALKAVDCRRISRPDGFVEPGQFLPLNPDLERLNRMTAAHLGIPYHASGRSRAVGLSAGGLSAGAAKASITLRRYAGSAVRKTAPWLLSGRRQAN